MGIVLGHLLKRLGRRACIAVPLALGDGDEDEDEDDEDEGGELE